MNPTLEEVKKVATVCEIFDLNGYINELSLQTLLAFAHHWMKEQRESDANLCDNMADKTLIGKTENYPGEYTDEGCNYAECAEAIRNNTGE